MSKIGVHSDNTRGRVSETANGAKNKWAQSLCVCVQTKRTKRKKNKNRKRGPDLTTDPNECTHTKLALSREAYFDYVIIVQLII